MYDENKIAPKIDFDLDCDEYGLLEQLKNATDNPRVKYEVNIKIEDIEDESIHFSVLFPEIFAKSRDNREKYGKIFMYKRKILTHFLSMLNIQ